MAVVGSGGGTLGALQKKAAWLWRVSDATEDDFREEMARTNRCLLFIKWQVMQVAFFDNTEVILSQANGVFMTSMMMSIMDRYTTYVDKDKTRKELLLAGRDGKL